MNINLFEKKCECGGIIIGPREGGKARGRWLGYDQCLKCREKLDARK
ncbi:MAG: hypothetical protein GW859_05375 [Sphingomonadales bacterium]|nr:hypothetical protein [Sphingomonadales bacterium]